MSGNVVMIDGSPLFFQKFSQTVEKSIISEDNIQNKVLITLIGIDSTNERDDVVKKIILASDWNTKLDLFMKLHETKQSFKRLDLKEYISAIMERFRMTQNLNMDSFPMLERSKLSIVRPTDYLVLDIDDNYGLQQYSPTEVNKLLLTGNHVSILESVELCDFINELS